MLEILNFPKERFLYLIPYTPIKYTLYSLPIYNLRYPIFKYTKSPVQMKIQFRTTSHDKTKYSGTDPTAPRNFAQKLLSAKIKRTFVKIKHPLCSKQDAHKPSP